MREKAAEKADAAATRVVDYARLTKMSLEELLYYVLVGEEKRAPRSAGA